MCGAKRRGGGFKPPIQRKNTLRKKPKFKVRRVYLLMTTSSSSPTIVLAAGGTGGHLFPAQALAQNLLARGYRVVLLTDKRFAAYTKGFEGVEIIPIPAGRSGSGIKAKLLGFCEMIYGVWVARGILSKLQPRVVVGFGGYPSFPTMQAAIWLRLPTMIHEQNRRIGRANRLLAGGVMQIATSFPDMRGLTPANTPICMLTGNPVRPAILAMQYRAYRLPKKDDALWNILIFGGSQGARIFSEVVPLALGQLPESLRKRLRITQQARPEELAKTQESYRHNGIVANIQPFINDMPEQLAHAHLVICRAGASTLAELMVVGRPAILAPYPFAADNHQRDNAEFFVEHGAGWLLPDASLTAETLAAMLTELFASPTRLTQAAAAAKSLALPQAAEALTAAVEASLK
jgi:UDP-N-acetylglucosamine--N-acetylmuramyl-(pentapeptide) pyrophosphoryl-undecaprenol N-acetylglucosamine transferase